MPYHGPVSGCHHVLWSLEYRRTVIRNREFSSRPSWRRAACLPRHVLRIGTSGFLVGTLLYESVRLLEQAEGVWQWSDNISWETSFCGSRKLGDWSMNVTSPLESTGVWCFSDLERNPLNQLRSVHWMGATSPETTWWLSWEVVSYRSWKTGEGRPGVFPDLHQNMKSTRTLENSPQ